MNKIYFTSDTHFGHGNVLGYCPNRKFETIEDHDAYLINTWNSKIKPDDTVFHLGDFSFGSVDYGVQLLNKLNGKKVLVAGNHDARHLNKPAFCNGWRVIHNSYYELRDSYNGQNVFIVLCHYPLETWNKQHYGSFHLHGHVHSTPSFSKVRVVKNRQDVGVDSREDLGPWEKNELLSSIEQKYSVEGVVKYDY